MLFAILWRFHSQAVLEALEVPRSGSKSLLYKVQVDDIWTLMPSGVHLEGHRAPFRIGETIVIYITFELRSIERRSLLSSVEVFALGVWLKCELVIRHASLYDQLTVCVEAKALRTRSTGLHHLAPQWLQTYTCVCTIPYSVNAKSVSTSQHIDWVLNDTITSTVTNNQETLFHAIFLVTSNQ